MQLGGDNLANRGCLLTIHLNHLNQAVASANSV